MRVQESPELKLQILSEIWSRFSFYQIFLTGEPPHPAAPGGELQQKARTPSGAGPGLPDGASGPETPGLTPEKETSEEPGKKRKAWTRGERLDRSLTEKTGLPERRQDPHWLQKARKQAAPGKPELRQARPESGARRSLVFWRMIPEADSGTEPGGFLAKPEIKSVK